MLYTITHTTTYTYSQPVTLAPHTLRLRPRSDGHQTLQSFELTVTPALILPLQSQQSQSQQSQSQQSQSQLSSQQLSSQQLPIQPPPQSLIQAPTQSPPIQQSTVTDLDGNTHIKLWFAPAAVTELIVTARSHIITHLTQPFNYLLEPWALSLPIDYPTSLREQLQPYLASPGFDPGFDPAVIALAQDISRWVQGDTTQFVMQLNQRIYETCQQVVREIGNPHPAGFTWAQRSGSCRDLTVLMMAACRAVGLAARFVSGYQEGLGDELHLHAWAEIYLPGAGWRGYDPTRGLAVSDRHIALVASAQPSYTAPIVGSITPASAGSVLHYRVAIQIQDSFHD